MLLKDRHRQQVSEYNTKKDHRSHNSKVNRTLRAMAEELKDLPHDKQVVLDYIINDLRDGYKFDWLGYIDFVRATSG